ncbi:GNAT family N-acetyltransferase [Streptacidiphilus fuscans]|uniref:GNAT family N-acetyltransferase n=1 Tax=Streptacidiphilus fuscans TaxID=2789292 RepID=A0A931FGX5_9ACTN|nr:GNAT family N-acetyltransferase [Streptacidiphilus fuscans]MBF9071720.1 GNAT family N-acetyltransferase [Streptacidiphilus fuscans]
MLLTRPDGLVLDTDPTRIDRDRVHHWLSTDAYWAIGRSHETMMRSLDHSLVFGVYRDDEQVAFARVVTDYAVFAWLADVYVAREVRGRGIGTWLAESVVAELAPYRLRRLMLATDDAHGVYARAGFVPVPDPQRLMSFAAPTAPSPDPTEGALPGSA